ncbi:MAG: hypothetical protein HQL91_01670 [Magnetococcales bacterium]|nr:hypothetical protein [Magnetococcales bacterium]
MNITPAALEAEWNRNLQQRKRRTIRDVTAAEVVRALAAGPDDPFFALLGLKPHQLLKRKSMMRHFAPLRAFAWRQAVLYTHPAHLELFMATLRVLAADLPGMTRPNLELLFNDLTFFNLITDTFNEDGFISCGLHVTQRVLGEIENRPENLDWAVGVSQWVEEHYLNDREVLEGMEVG